MTGTHTDAAFALVLGGGAVLVGCFGRKFYALGPGQRVRENSRTIPTRLGRIWFVVIGSAMVYWSFSSVLGTWNHEDLREGYRLAGAIAVVSLVSFAARWLKSRFAAGKPLRRETTVQQLFPKP